MILRRGIYSYNVTENILATELACGSGWLRRYSVSLRAGRSEDRIPVRSRFSAHVRTGPGVYQTSCTMGAGSLPAGVKRLGLRVEHPLHLAPRLRELQGCTSSPRLGLRGLFWGDLD